MKNEKRKSSSVKAKIQVKVQNEKALKRVPFFAKTSFLNNYVLPHFR